MKKIFSFVFFCFIAFACAFGGSIFLTGCGAQNPPSEQGQETPSSPMPEEDEEHIEAQKTSFDFTIIPVVWTTYSSYTQVSTSSSHSNIADYCVSFDTQWRSEKDATENFSVDSHTYYTAYGQTSSYDDTNYYNIKYLDYNYSHTFNYQACLKVTMSTTSYTGYTIAAFGGSTVTPSNSSNTASLSTVYLYQDSSGNRYVVSSHPGDSTHYQMSGTFYLIYRRKYTVTFKDTYTNYSQTKTSYAGIAYTLPTAPTRTGYTFQGWTNGSLTLRAAATNMVLEYSHYTSWTAEWAANTYTVTLVSDVGVIPGSSTSEWTGDGAQVTKTVTYGSTYGSLPVPLPVSGYTFAGWYTDLYGTGTQKTTTSTVSTAGNHYLYAAYQSSVTYDGNGYDYGTVPTQQTYYYGGGSATIAQNSLSKNGFIANGWNGSSDYTATPEYAGGESYSDNDLKLYANFSPIAVDVSWQKFIETDLNGEDYDDDYLSGFIVDVSYTTTVLSGNSTTTATTSLASNQSAGIINARANSQITFSNIVCPDGYVCTRIVFTDAQYTYKTDMSKNTSASYMLVSGAPYNVNIYFKQVSDNRLKYDAIEKYFYFEDGEFPQTAVVTYNSAFNTFLTDLTPSSTFEANGITFSIVEYAYDSSLDDASYAGYDGQRFLGFQMPSTKTISLKNDSVDERTFSAGTTYWFKYDPIRWRVSDYGVSETDLPADWDTFAEGQTNYNVASDVLWWDVLNDSSNELGAGNTAMQTTLMQKLSNGEMFNGMSLNYAGSMLPEEYKQVEYIESTGTQYIDTGYAANNNTTVEMKALSNSTANQAFYCSRTGMSSNTFACIIVSGKIRHDYNTTQSSVNVSASVGLTYNIVQSKNTLTVNGVTNTIAAGTFTAGTNMYLGASNANGIGNYLIGRIYYCRIYDGDTLIRNFVPCYRESDGVAGLYDLVEGKFYTNAGSGSYTSGGAGTSANINIDSWATAGTNQKVTSENVSYMSSNAFISSLDEITTYQNDLRSYASQLVAVLAGRDQTKFFEYWTRDFGQQIGCGTYVTASGIVNENTSYSRAKGVRFGITMTEGSYLGGNISNNLVQGLDSSFTATGNNCTLSYNANTETFTFTNTGTYDGSTTVSDPYAAPSQLTAYLEAGKTYRAYMDVESIKVSTGVENASAYLCIYNLGAKVLKTGTGWTTFTVSTTKTYTFTFENEMTYSAGGVASFEKLIILEV